MAIRLGTRNSLLARWQAEWVATQLNRLGVEVALTPIATRGDRQQGPIASLGGDGIFTKAIEQELLDGRIDLGVHSLKDLPTSLPAGLCLAAVPQRGAAGDVLACGSSRSLDGLPAGATVGTSSLRRRAQMLHCRPDLQPMEIRGNVETRLRKLDQGQYDALILAEAGLQRLGMADQIAQRLPLTVFLPAIGQGALAVESRVDDHTTRAQIAGLDDFATHAAVLAEREMLAGLHGGCLAPVAGFAQVENRQLTLRGRVLSYDGTRLLEGTWNEALNVVDITAGAAVAVELGRRAASALLAQGAAELITTARAFFRAT
jgi:hydroxymethylbilane synthase